MAAAGPARFVRLKVAGIVTPAAVALTEYGPPTVLLAVKVGAVAMPDALVETVAVFNPPVKVPLAPEEGAVNVTLTFGTGLPLESLTVAVSAAKALVIATAWGVPLVAAMTLAAPGVLVKLNGAAAVTPYTDALTVYAPVVLLAVKTAEVATPEEFVVAVFTPPANVPPAPEAGVVKVTTTPLTGLLPASVTVAASGEAKAVSF
jgi:hypothetical protein